MIPVWQLMLGVCVGLVALVLTRPQAIQYNTENKKKTHGGNPKFNSKPEDLCVICLYEMTNLDMTYLRCGHALHETCYRQHQRHSKHCPICRQSL